MFKRTVRIVALMVMATSAAVVGLAGPSFADSGGGCTITNNVSVCISVRSGTTNPLLPDFYLNNSGRGECYATPAIIYNDSSNSPSHNLTSAPIKLISYGHYGPWSETKALSSGRARLRLTLMDCNKSVLYVAYSPEEMW